MTASPVTFWSSRTRPTSAASQTSASVFDVDTMVDMPITSLGIALSSAGLTTAEIQSVPAVINGETLSMRERMVIALTRRLGV